METIQLTVDKNVDKEKIYSQAVDLLNQGEVVAFPTETVYGLGAVATNDEAVKKFMKQKGAHPIIPSLYILERLKK